MGNFDKYEGFLGSASSEDGSSLESQFDIYADSLEAMQAKATNSWKTAMQELVSPDLLKGLAKISKGFGDVFGGALSGINGLEGVISMLTPMLIDQFAPAFSTAFKTVNTAIKYSAAQAGDAVLSIGGKQKFVSKLLKDENKEITDQFKATRDGLTSLRDAPSTKSILSSTESTDTAAVSLVN
jgi:hypothetical protein